MIFICLFIFFVLNIGIFVSFFKKKATAFTLFYISYLWLYDWLFISLSYHLSSNLLFLMKSFQEIAMVLLLFVFFVGQMISKRKFTLTKFGIIFSLCVIFPLVIALFNSFYLGHSVEQIIQGGRYFFLPVIIPFLLYKYGLFENLDIKKIKILFYFFLVGSFILALIQVKNFSGNLEELWFYQFFDKGLDGNVVADNPWNYIREGNFRATGLFVSSIMLTIFFAITGIYSLLTFVVNRNYIALIFFIISFLGIQLTQTRIGLLIMLLSIGIILIMHFKKGVSLSMGMLFCIPIFLIFFTFLVIKFGVIDDLSAQGRPVQYLSFFSDFKLLGSGLGSDLVLVKYDSFYISIFLACGIFSIMYVWYFFYLLKWCYRSLKKTVKDSEKYIFDMLTLIIGLTFIYAFAFQFLAGSFLFKLIFVFIFISIEAIKNDSETILVEDKIGTV